MNNSLEIKNLMKEILQRMKIDGVIKVDSTENFLKINIEDCSDAALLIGYRGETLRSLQHIAKILFFNKELVGKDTRIILDVDSYLSKKDQELENLALNMAEKVIKTGHVETFPPMTSYERRKIHALFTDHEKIITESIGIEPTRRIVIKLK